MKRWKRKELEGSDTRTRVSVAEREIKKPLWYTRSTGSRLGEQSEVVEYSMLDRAEGVGTVGEGVEPVRTGETVNSMAMVRTY